MLTTQFVINGSRRGLKSGAKGFTLVEMLLVLLILATLAAIVVPKFAGRTEQAKITAAQTQINSFETVLDAFEVDNGYYPKGEDGLQDLVVQPRDANKWHGPYINEVPNDPWERPYIYTCPGKYNQNAYDVLSIGPDGRSGTEDDIANYTIGKSR